MKPSNARVLELLRSRGAEGITDRDALLYAHTSRLAARVHELRFVEGFDISGTLETANGARYARYVLRERPEQLVLLDSPVTAPLRCAPFLRSRDRGAERRLPARPGAG